MRTRPCNEPASAPRAAPMTLERLPRELCGVVFSHLRPADMVVLSMCSRRRCDAFLDDLYWKPRYLAVFPRPRISPSASYHLWQNMYKKRWRERRRARRIEGDTCAMGLRLGNMLGSYAPREMSPPTTAASWMAETPDGANGLSRLSREVELWEEDEEDDRLLIRGPPGPRHGLMTVRDSGHTSRPIRYFVEAHADIGPDRGEMDVSSGSQMRAISLASACTPARAFCTTPSARRSADAESASAPPSLNCSKPTGSAPTT